jgi:hypothetical protein
MDSNNLGHSPVLGSCEHVKEPSYFLQSRGFTDQLNDHHVPEDPTACCWL